VNKTPFYVILSFFILLSTAGGGPSPSLAASTADQGALRNIEPGLPASPAGVYNDHPKLSFSLNRLLEDRRSGQGRAVLSIPGASGLQVKEERVWVVLVVEPETDGETLEEKIDEMTNRIENAGGQVELVYRHLIQAWLPVAGLELMGDRPEVRFIREPLRPRAVDDSAGRTGSLSGSGRSLSAQGSVTSEGVSLIAANQWHSAGWSGDGVKIAVVDLGFADYPSLLGTELPSTVTTKFYGTVSDISSTPHGTACAEIVHDVAPGASMYLSQPRTEVELGNAVTWCLSQGVQIVSYSIGWTINAGPLDGTGIINDIVNDAVNGGILWVNSAGNQAQAHWGGLFSDADGDGWMNFQGTKETNGFAVYENEEVYIGMNWNDPWGASDNDYDLFVYRLDNLSSPAAYSMDVQNGNDDPAEFIAFTPVPGVLYGMMIRKVSGTAKTLQVNFLTQNELEYPVAATSLDIPADNPGVVSVGAVAWNTPSVIESFSSQGPTTDGRIKPDLVGPDFVSTATYGTGAFGGTSASCPHVAGAAALVQEASPSWTAEQIRNLLESRAVDQGTPGKDNVFGGGLVHLGEPINAVYAYSYYIPYYSGLKNDGTGVALRNPSTSAEAHGRITVYDQSGNILSTSDETIPERGQIARIYGAGTLKEGWIRIDADKMLTGLSFMGRWEIPNLMFDVPISGSTSTALQIPHVAQNGTWSTTVLACNPGQEPATVTLTYVDGSGIVKATKIHAAIPAKGSGAFPLSGLLGAIQVNNGSIEISSTSPISASALFENLKSGGYCYAGINAVDPSNP